jgi:hypothetical protein
MRRTLLTLAILGSLIAPTTAAAADSGTVSAQVTVAAPCITVGPNLDFGTARFTQGSTPIPTRSTSYSNCSEWAQRIYARGTDAVSATSAATWQLSPFINCDPNGLRLNEFILTLRTASGSTTLSDSSDTLFDEAAPAGATRALGTELIMPCSGSDGAGETMTFSIILTATF